MLDIKVTLRAAREDLVKLQNAIEALEALEGNSASAPVAETVGKRHMSPAQRRRMSKAMKKRWAEKRKASKTNSTLAKKAA